MGQVGQVGQADCKSARAECIMFGRYPAIEPRWNTLRFKISDFIPWGKQIPHCVSE